LSTQTRQTRQRWLIALATLAIGLCATMLPRPAAAQDVPDLQLQRFRPAAGPADYLTTYSSAVAQKWQPSGALYFDFADGPLRLATSSNETNEPVSTQITGSLMANIGLFGRAEVNLLLPVTLLQQSQQLQPALTPLPNGSARLTPQALNDMRLAGKYRALNLQTHPVGLAFVGALNIPTGTREALTSDRSVGFEAQSIVETWLWRGARLAVNLGYRYRARAIEFGSATIGDELLWSVGANIPLLVSKLDLLTEFDGAISLARDNRPGSLHEGERPTEFRAGIRYEIIDGWTLTTGFGSRLGNGVGVPDVRGFVSIGGFWVSGGQFSYDYDDDGLYGSADQCPEGTEDVDRYKDGDGCPDPDNDSDGILDVNDKCRNTPAGSTVDSDGCVENDLDGDGVPNDRDECFEDPEDYDNHEDGDGCPDPDNDGDGIADLADSCPDQPETVNDYHDEDGCPDEAGEHIKVVDEKIVLNHKIHFETGNATLQQTSHEVLGELAGALKKNDQLVLVRVEGHTDNQGSRQTNRKLSQRRAESVRNYLIDRGVSPERLAATGFGETQPVATNKTDAGRAKNRRVEFQILKRSDRD
jgi:outer membrane protein OmpA-like peptidoglycan-associated protein